MLQQILILVFPSVELPFSTVLSWPGIFFPLGRGGRYSETLNMYIVNFFSDVYDVVS